MVARLLVALLVLIPTCAPQGAGTLAPPSGLVSAGQLTLATDPVYPPQEFYMSQALVGFDVDLGRELARRMGLRATFIAQEFGSLLDGLQAEHYDAVISALAITPSRASRMLLVPYLSAGEVLMTRRGAPAASALSDVCGMRVGVESGTAAEDLARGITCSSAPVIMSYASDVDEVAALRRADVDVEIVDSPQADWEVANDNSLAVTSPVFEAQEEGIGVRVGDRALCEALVAALTETMGDATYARLLRRWAIPGADVRTLTRPSAAAACGPRQSSRGSPATASPTPS